MEGKVQIVQLDIINYNQVQSVAKHLRNKAIDILINNAGDKGAQDQSTSFGGIDLNVSLDLIKINTISPMKVTEAFIDNIRQGQLKKIVFISSRAGSISERGILEHHVPAGSYVYRSSKAALNAMAQSLAFDLSAEGISVLVLHPGWVRTEMGGFEADIDAVASVTGMRKVIEEFNSKDQNRFRNYNGEVIQW